MSTLFANHLPRPRRGPRQSRARRQPCPPRKRWIPRVPALPPPTLPRAFRQHLPSGTPRGGPHNHRGHFHDGTNGAQEVYGQSQPPRNQELESRNSGAVGNAVSAREPPGPAWGSISARESGSSINKPLSLQTLTNLSTLLEDGNGCLPCCRRLFGRPPPRSTCLVLLESLSGPFEFSHCLALVP